MQELILYFKDQFLNNDFFSGAVSATIIGSFLYQLKSIPKAIWGRIERKLTYTVTIYQHSELFTALEYYLFHHHYKKYRTVEASIDGEVFNDEPCVPREGNKEETKEKPKIKFSHHSDEFVIWIKKFPIHITNGREKMENAGNLKNAFIIHFSMKALLGKKRINSLLDQVLDQYNQTKVEKVTTDIYVNGYTHWDRIKQLKKSFTNVVLPLEDKNSLLQDLSIFGEIKSTYQRMDIPYKRGYLFYGKPGNGKTSLAAAMADHLKKNICYLNLKSIGEDQQLQSLFTNLPHNSILIIEDIDTCFNGRKSNGKITFSSLLNCLDGVFYKEDLITIITTNHIKKLDPALIRPGRIDFQLHIKNPTRQCIEQYLSLYYAKEVHLSNYTNQYSMADIVKFCIQNNELHCINTIENKIMKTA